MVETENNAIADHIVLYIFPLHATILSPVHIILFFISRDVPITFFVFDTSLQTKQKTKVALSK